MRLNPRTAVWPRLARKIISIQLCQSLVPGFALISSTAGDSPRKSICHSSNSVQPPAKGLRTLSGLWKTVPTILKFVKNSPLISSEESKWWKYLVFFLGPWRWLGCPNCTYWLGLSSSWFPMYSDEELHPFNYEKLSKQVVFNGLFKRGLKQSPWLVANSLLISFLTSNSLTTGWLPDIIGESLSQISPFPHWNFRPWKKRQFQDVWRRLPGRL